MRTLIFHTGSLGDTLVAVPALWAFRTQFPQAQLTLLTDRQVTGSNVGAEEVLEGSGLIDEWLTYPAGRNMYGKVAALRGALGAYLAVKKGRFEKLIYLIRTRPPWLKKRDILYFRFAGVREFLGINGWDLPPYKNAAYPLPNVMHQADLLLQRLSSDGLVVPPPGKGRVDVGIREEERSASKLWWSGIPGAKGRLRVALGPGSKMAAKRWPLERFQEVVKRLIRRYDVWPVVFGGNEDRSLGDHLLERWGRGTNAAGALGVRAGIAAMEGCGFYLGNDTGTMHMAVSAGIPCVAIFSARDYPGLWYPYGHGHIVLRRTVHCEGCMLEVCHKNGKNCLMSISVDEVLEACTKMIERISGSRRTQNL